MRVIISGRGVVITPAFRARVDRKVQNLSRILPNIHDAKVVLSAEKYRRTAEVTLLGKGKVFHSEETAPDLTTAVDLSVDALARQVRQTKDRLRERKPRRSTPGTRAEGRVPMPEAWVAPVGDRQESSEAGGEPVVITRQVTPKPMSVEEAAMQFRLGRSQFLVFTNATTGVVNVLYRRQDGELGLIEPVA